MAIQKLIILLSFLSSIAFSAVSFVQKPQLIKNGQSWNVSFELNEYADVEVAIVDTAANTILCHLAAGKLGTKPPPPLTANSKVQTLVWDGKNDYGESVNTAHTDVRVRVGMTASLDKIAGGDPYAFYSRDMRGGNHNIWSVAGLEAKLDGSVYVYGSANQMGVYTVRKYDQYGNYIKTVFPFPSGMAANKVSGWGVNTKADGTYAPKVPYVNYVTWPVYTSTPINLMSGWGPQPSLIHSRDTSKLLLASAANFQLFSFNTDGSIDPVSTNQYSGYLTENPRIQAATSVFGPPFISYTPDSLSYYLSGICRTDTAFWREGKIWKVDAATRTPVIWYSITGSTSPGVGGNQSYSAIHGTAVDENGNVFVCNRLQSRIDVLDSSAQLIRSIPFSYPDAIEYDKSTKALYVASRFGYQGLSGNVKIHKISNWKTDNGPVFSLKLCDLYMSDLNRDRTYIAIVGSGTAKRIWVAFKDIGAVIFKESGDTLLLEKDFYQSGKKQRFLGFQRMTVDPVTENAYIASGDIDVFKLTDWNNPVYIKCSLNVPRVTAYGADFSPGGFSDPQQLASPDLTIDVKNRFLLLSLLVLGDDEVVYRHALDEPYHRAVSWGSTGKAAISGVMPTNESEGCLYRDRGIAPTPDGGIVAVNGWGTGGNAYQNLQLQYHYVDPDNGTVIRYALDSVNGRSGGIRTDPKGNVYIGARNGAAWTAPDSVPVGYAGDKGYAYFIGKIYKYSPTGTKEPGKLFNNVITKPVKEYRVGFGKLPQDQNGTNARFGVDAYGRIYYPNSLTQSVHVMDNEGNELLKFGTYGNLDAWLALEGKWSSATEVPMSWPNSVDASENYIYVADFVNSGIVRMEKKFILDNMDGRDFGHTSANNRDSKVRVPAMLTAAPNPFTGSNSITLNLSKKESITLKIFDMAGREVSLVTKANLQQGLHTFKWNGKNSQGLNAAAGVYFVKLITSGRALHYTILKLR